MQHNILIFIKISTWIGFNYPPKIRPKNTELCIRLVLQEKIRHTHHMPHVSQKKSYNHRTAGILPPKASRSLKYNIKTECESCKILTLLKEGSCKC